MCYSRCTPDTWASPLWETVWRFCEDSVRRSCKRRFGSPLCSIERELRPSLAQQHHRCHCCWSNNHKRCCMHTSCQCSSERRQALVMHLNNPFKNKSQIQQQSGQTTNEGEWHQSRTEIVFIGFQSFGVKCSIWKESFFIVRTWITIMGEFN